MENFNQTNKPKSQRQQFDDMRSEVKKKFIGEVPVQKPSGESKKAKLTPLREAQLLSRKNLETIKPEIVTEAPILKVDETVDNTTNLIRQSMTFVSPYTTLDEVRAAKTRREERARITRAQEAGYSQKVAELNQRRSSSDSVYDLPSKPVVPAEQTMNPELEETLENLKNSRNLDNSDLADSMTVRKRPVADLSQYMAKQKPRSTDTSSKAS
jgi:hypothetical protein